jgi:hypothetical protein
MRYWTESTVVRAPWSIAGPSPVCFLIAVLMMPSAARSETLVDAYYASVKATAPSNPFPPHTLSAGYRDGIQSRPAQSDAESYRMGYAQANRILDRPAAVVPEVGRPAAVAYTSGCANGACRVYAKVKPAAVVRAAPLPGQHSHRCSACSYVWSHYPGQSHTCPSCGQPGNYARYGGSSGVRFRLFGRR